MTTTKARIRSTGTANATIRRVDWSLTPRTALAATLQAGTGLVAIAGATTLADTNPLWAAGGAAVGRGDPRQSRGRPAAGTCRDADRSQ